MSLFLHSILWDLNVPQEAIAYKDNDWCTAMGNMQKPTTRTQHIDIKYFALCEWVECNLIRLEWIDTSINIADNLTKPHSKILIHLHTNFLLRYVRPTYSPVRTLAITTYTNQHAALDLSYNSTYNCTYPDVNRFVPSTFTTPITAKIATMFVLTHDDIQGNPWLPILWHE